MATHTYTFYSTKSAVVSSTTPNQHIALSSAVKLLGVDGNTPSFRPANAVLLRFDLSTVPAGEMVKSIKLYVYVSGVEYPSTGTYGAIINGNKTTNDFDASAVTFNSFSPSPHTLSSEFFANAGGQVPAYKSGNLSGVSLGGITVILQNNSTVSGGGQPTINTTASQTNIPYIEITTEDSVPTATELKPKQSYISGDVVQRLSWAYANESGGEQKAFALQKSTNGTTWVDVISLTTTSRYYDAPEGTFAAGTAYWRVKVTSQWDIQSEWSEAALVMVISAPATPTITAVDATPRPIVSWQSVGQQAYQVRIGSHDSGIVYGTDKSYKSPVYLPDGETPVMVRIMNQYRMWSGWAEMIATITHAGVAAVSLRATHDNSDIYLDWTGAHDIYYVYRDGALIAKTRDKAYIDHMAIGAHDYRVRGATGEAYDLSRDVAVTACCKTAMIAEAGVYDWIHLRCRRQGKPSTSASITQQIAYQHYAGRELPVADITEYADEAYTFAYSVLHDTGALRGLLGKTVVIKTPRGECVIGVLESLPYERDRWATDYTLTIRAIDYNPGVTYDV